MYWLNLKKNILKNQNLKYDTVFVNIIIKPQLFLIEQSETIDVSITNMKDEVR